MFNICGIDPGLNGAYAVLDDTGKVVIAGQLQLVETKNKRPRIDADHIYRTLHNYNVAHGIIENVGVRPGQGIASSGAFMRAFGTAEAALTIKLGRQVTWVTPQVWKKHYNFEKGSTKEASRLKALDIWPDATDWFTPRRLWITKKSAQDVAEASLIARWYFETRVTKVRKLLPAGGEKVSLVRN